MTVHPLPSTPSPPSTAPSAPPPAPPPAPPSAPPSTPPSPETVAASTPSPTLPSPYTVPGPRTLLLTRDPQQFDTPGFPGYSERAPTLASPRFTGNNRLTVWNRAMQDFYGRRPRAEQHPVGVPQLRGLPSSGVIYLTAPYDRPVPYVAWVQIFLRPTPGGLPSPAYRESRVAVIRHLPRIGSGSFAEYRIVCEYHDRCYTHQDEIFHPYAFGFDVVPPGQTFEISAGWGVSDTSLYGMRMYDFGSGDPEQNRFQFGVMSLLPV